MYKTHVQSLARFTIRPLITQPMITMRIFLFSLGLFVLALANPLVIWHPEHAVLEPLPGVVDAVPPPALSKRQAITLLAASQISTFKPFTFFASTAYCNPSNTLAWNCGSEFLSV